MSAYSTAIAVLRRIVGGARDPAPLQPRASVEAALHARLALLPFEPRQILDLGESPRDGAKALTRRWRHARVVAVSAARGRSLRDPWPWQRRVPQVAAHATRLPFRDDSFDLVCSNLLLQRAPDVDAMFAEVERVLRVGGCFAFSTLGAATLAELRAARADADPAAPAPRFPDLLALGDALLAAGLRDPVIDADRHTLTYTDTTALLRDLRALGGRIAAQLPGLGGRARLRRLAAAYEPARAADGRLPATFEVLYGRAFKSAPAAPRVPAEVTIAPAAIGRLRR